MLADQIVSVVYQTATCSPTYTSIAQMELTFREIERRDEELLG